MPHEERTSTVYEFNGKRFASLEEMPPEVRRFFEDRNGDGRPDGFESILERHGLPAGVKVTTSTRSVTKREWAGDRDKPPFVPPELSSLRPGAPPEPYDGLSSEAQWRERQCASATTAKYSARLRTIGTALAAFACGAIAFYLLFR